MARVAAAMNEGSIRGRFVIQATNAVMVASLATLIEKYWAKSNVRPMEARFNA